MSNKTSSYTKQEIEERLFNLEIFLTFFFSGMFLLSYPSVDGGTLFVTGWVDSVIILLLLNRRKASRCKAMNKSTDSYHLPDDLDNLASPTNPLNPMNPMNAVNTSNPLNPLNPSATTTPLNPMYHDLD